MCWQSSIWRTTHRTTRGPAPYSSANPRTMVSSRVSYSLTDLWVQKLKSVTPSKSVWGIKHFISRLWEERFSEIHRRSRLRAFFSLWRADVCKFMPVPRRHLTDGSSVLWGVQSHCDGGDINVFLRAINNTAWDHVFIEAGGNKQEDNAAFVMFKVDDK